MIKVCHFSTVHPLNDSRVFIKECRSTASKEGFEVHLIIQHDNDELRDGVYIHALKKGKGRLYRIFIARLIAFFKCLKIKAHVYHFHDPELLSIGIWLRICGKKVVYDVHEDYPEQILDKKWLGPVLIRKLISKLFYAYEQFASWWFSGIVTATDTIKDKFSPKKTITIFNFASLEIMDKVKPNQDEVIPDNKKIVIYSGGLTRIRGIVEVIKAVEANPDCELWLFGKFESKDFENECKQMAGWERTKWFGFQPLEVMFSYLRLADVGVCLLHPLPRYLVALPTKAFEYMTYELPTLHTHSEFWESFFGDSIYFTQFEQSEINSKLAELLENAELRKELGRKGRSLIEEKYCWERELPKLIDMYKRIA